MQYKMPTIQELSNTLQHAVETLAIADVETESKLREHQVGQPLDEDVGELRSRWDVEDIDVPDGNALADKVKTNLNMLGALVLNGVGGDINDSDVVVIDQSDSRQGVVQLHKQQLMKHARLCHAVGHDAVLRLNARTGDDVLTLHGPGDKVIAQ
jgi:hypothetical protein